MGTYIINARLHKARKKSLNVIECVTGELHVQVFDHGNGMTTILNLVFGIPDKACLGYFSILLHARIALNSTNEVVQ